MREISRASCGGERQGRQKNVERVQPERDAELRAVQPPALISLCLLLMRWRAMQSRSLVACTNATFLISNILCQHMATT